MGILGLIDSKALTKVQSIVLIAIIVVAAVGGTAYLLFTGEDPPSETIKIGIFADLDGSTGRHVWRGAILAAEHLNAKGGILGRQVEVIGEDSDEETNRDLTRISSALTRLITLNEVDLVIAAGAGAKGFVLQDLSAEHKKILICYGGSTAGITQRVIDDYDKYKYYFRYFQVNSTWSADNIAKYLSHARDITGFNNVGYLADDGDWNLGNREKMETALPEYGFNLVYKGKFPGGTFDFSSYFAAAEAAGVEILVPMSLFDSGIPLLKEYYDRQSPMLIYGGSTVIANSPEIWEQTDGKCVYMSTFVAGVTVGYPISNQTVPFHNSYIQRWGETPIYAGASSYDIIRFVLSEALKKAGTSETEDVIKALEEIEVETTQARKFAFTSSHDVLKLEEFRGTPENYGHIGGIFQWQEDGSRVPIFPKWLMDEANATITFPPWAGPWDDLE
jgi:branched-chain amino acid transport system substrate-binding protein